MKIQWAVFVDADGGNAYKRDIKPEELIIPPQVGQKMTVGSFDDVCDTEVAYISRDAAGIVVWLETLTYVCDDPDNSHPFPTNEEYINDLLALGWERS